MADEPDQYIKMSTIYHNLKTILGDDDEWETWMGLVKTWWR
jgi:hypothetical protein